MDLIKQHFTCHVTIEIANLKSPSKIAALNVTDTRTLFFISELHGPELMVPGKIGDGQAELKVLGLDVDVDVAHHVH